MAEDAGVSLSTLFHQPPPGYERRAVVIPPGGGLAYDEERWRDCIVLVQDGVIELRFGDGSRYRLGRGEVFWLAGLPVRELHNAGPEMVTLITITRRPTVDSFPDGRPSR